MSCLGDQFSRPGVPAYCLSKLDSRSHTRAPNPKPPVPLQSIPEILLHLHPPQRQKACMNTTALWEYQKRHATRSCLARGLGSKCTNRGKERYPNQNKNKGHSRLSLRRTYPTSLFIPASGRNAAGVVKHMVILLHVGLSL